MVWFDKGVHARLVEKQHVYRLQGNTKMWKVIDNGRLTQCEASLMNPFLDPPRAVESQSQTLCR